MEEHGVPNAKVAGSTPVSRFYGDTMRVIKSSKTAEFTCVNCGSVLEVAPEDIQTSDVGHPYGAWFICLVCGKRNCMDGKIPQTWNSIVFREEFGH